MLVGSDECPEKRVDSDSVYMGHRPRRQNYYARTVVDSHSCWVCASCDEVVSENGQIVLILADDIRKMALRDPRYRPRSPPGQFSISEGYLLLAAPKPGSVASA